MTFHEARVIDDYGSDAERAQARLEDTETRWQDVPDELLINGDQIISFLDIKGFLYYLPAYLVWYLRYMGTASSNTFESVDYHLAADEGMRISDYRLERFKSLNFEQSKAVAQFLVFQLDWLKFLDEQDGEGTEIFDYEHRSYKWALDVYWGQFLPVSTV